MFAWRRAVLRHAMTSNPPHPPPTHPQELFRIAAEEPDRAWSFSVAVLEIYNEAVHDLLALSAAGGGEGSSGSPSKAPSAEVLARCTLEVSGLGSGELPPNMDRWGVGLMGLWGLRRVGVCVGGCAVCGWGQGGAQLKALATAAAPARRRA